MEDFEAARRKLLGAKRKKWRDDRGLTQPEVVEHLRPYSVRAFQAWEAGDSLTMRRAPLRKLAALYGMSIAELRDEDVTGVEEPPTDGAQSGVVDILGRLAGAVEELERWLRDQGSGGAAGAR